MESLASRISPILREVNIEQTNLFVLRSGSPNIRHMDSHDRLKDLEEAKIYFNLEDNEFRC